MKRSIYLLMSLIMLSCAKDAETPTKPITKVITVNDPNLTAKFNGDQGNWPLNANKERDFWTIEEVNDINSLAFIGDIDSVKFDIKKGDSVFIDVILKEKDTAHIGVICIAKPILNYDPLKAVIHTEDLDNFWAAYHLVQEEKDSAVAIYQRAYIDKASKGMLDYMDSKVKHGAEQLVDHLDKHPKFYAAIENNTNKVETFKPGMMQSFQKLKEFYPDATFPDIYFVMGAFTSAGTVSRSGLLLGINQICRTDETPIDEFSFQSQQIMSSLKDVPTIVAHELIHFQQDNMVNDTITLGYVIKEGMADFMGELISGKVPNENLYEWAKGKEKRIWKAFQEDMYYDRYSNWIANAFDSDEENLGDQGYWIGYQICKSILYACER